MDKKPITTVIKAVKNAWGKDTAYHKDAERWTNKNPSIGQCAVTALVINHFFGGKIISGVSSDGAVHFWNRILGFKIDLTKSQFEGKKKFANLRVWNANDLILTGNVEKRYQALLRRTCDFLTKGASNEDQ
jgi:hypothetical protein